MVLACRVRFSYAVGHVLNDLAATMWFSYLLIYLHYVVKFNNSLSGTLLLIGQLADGISTTLVGLECDRVSLISKYGRKKGWHLLGVMCVLVSFGFIFNLCIGCSHSPDYAQFTYYAPFIVIFQFGWASTQISHLSLIPSLTQCKAERVILTSMRNGFTVVSNVTVYVLTLVILELRPDHHGSHVSTSLDVHDAGSFQHIVFIILVIGIIFSALFHVGTVEAPIGLPQKERTKSEVGGKISSENLVDSESNHNVPYCSSAPTDLNTEGSPRDKCISVSTPDGAVLPPVCSKNANRDEEELLLPSPGESIHVEMTWSDWFREPQFYLIAWLYMCARLIVNVSMVYLPLYVTETLNMNKRYIAIIPLVAYVSSFLSSLLAHSFDRCVGRKWTYFGGLMVTLVGSTLAWFAPQLPVYTVYIIAIFFGMGNATVLVSSLTLSADLIDKNTESSSFVYGALSFTDKVSNGVVIEIIQLLHPCKEVTCCLGCIPFYHKVFSLVPAGTAVAALFGSFFLIFAKVGHGRRKEARLAASSNCYGSVSNNSVNS